MTSTAAWGEALIQLPFSAPAPVEVRQAPAGSYFWAATYAWWQDPELHIVLVDDDDVEYAIPPQELFIAGEAVGIPVPDVPVGTRLREEWELGVSFTVVDADAWERLIAFPTVVGATAVGRTTETCRWTGGWPCGSRDVVTRSTTWVYVDNDTALRDPRLLVEMRTPRGSRLRQAVVDAQQHDNTANAVVFEHSSLASEPFDVRFVDAVTAEASEWQTVTPDVIGEGGCTQASSTTWLGWLALLVCLRRRHRRAA